MLKDYAEAFLAALLMTIRRNDLPSGETKTLITHCMKSDHPLVLLRQQYTIYYKSLINWEVFQTQAYESAAVIGNSLISSPLKVRISEELEKNPHNENNLPALSTKSHFLNDFMIQQIVERLPDYLKFRDWDLIFRPDKHGWSLNTFYRNCENYGSNVFVVKDDGHFVFGGFASTGWVHSRKFYGNGECFLFSFGNGEAIKSFFPTLANGYYMSSDEQCIIMGSG